MRTAAIWLLMVAGTLLASAQDEEFGEAVKRSLDRSRILYPESAQPDSALSKAILARIEWLQRHNRAAFRDPNWPLRVTATEAAALGIAPERAGSTQARTTPNPRFLALVTQSFSTSQASFRKDQQILLEAIQDYGKRGITLVNGEPVLLWLDNIQILRYFTPELVLIAAILLLIVCDLVADKKTKMAGIVVICLGALAFFLGALAFLALPAAVYLLSYVPWMRQGHTVADVLRTQRDVSALSAPEQSVAEAHTGDRLDTRN